MNVLSFYIMLVESCRCSFDPARVLKVLIIICANVVFVEHVACQAVQFLVCLKMLLMGSVNFVFADNVVNQLVELCLFEDVVQHVV